MVDVVGLRFVTDGQVEALDALRRYEAGLIGLSDLQNKHVSTMNRALNERVRAEERAARQIAVAQSARDAEDRRSFQVYLRYQREKEQAAISEAREQERAAQQIIRAKEEEARAQQRVRAETEMLARAYNPVMAATMAYERQVEQLNRAHDMGVLSADRLEMQMAQLQAAYARVGASTVQANRFVNQFGNVTQVAGMKTNRFGMYAQQVGYQVGDFFVQIQSGTNAFVAFGQQATQLAGLLPGVAGAVLGIGISVGTMFLAMWDRSRRATSGVDDLKDAMEALKSSARSAEVELAQMQFGFGSAEAARAALEMGSLLRQLRAAQEAYNEAQVEAIENEASLSAAGAAGRAAQEVRAIQARVDALQDEIDAYQEKMQLLEAEEARLESIQAFYDLRAAEAEQSAEREAGVERILQLMEQEKQAIVDQLTLTALANEYGVESLEYRQAALDIEERVYRAQLEQSGILGNNQNLIVAMWREMRNLETVSKSVSVVLANMSMSDQARAQAQFLAQDLGIALDVAIRLNAALDRAANIRLPDAGPRLGFGGVGSTMDDPLSTGMANTVLGFGNVEEAANNTWRAVRDLTSGMSDLNATAAGGGSPGGGGSTVDAMEQVREEMERATQAILDEANKTREQGIGRLADDLGGVFADFFDSGFRDFESFTDGILGIFQKMLVEMAAEAASAQIMRFLMGSGGSVAGGATAGVAATATATSGGGMMGTLSSVAGTAGAMTGLGGAIAGLAGPAAIAIGLFSIFRARQQRRNQEEKKESDERYRLETRLLELQGRTRELQRREIAALQPGNRALGRRIQLLEQQAAIDAQRDSLEMQLLELQGNVAEIRRRELAALDESNRALQEHIYMLEDQAVAAANAAAVQQERMTLEEQRLTLLGREDLLRQMQLDGLDASNHALQEEVWLLEAQAAAAEERLSLEEQWLELNGYTRALRARELREMDASNRKMQIRIWQLEDQQALDDERLALEKDLLTAQGDTAALRALELEALDASNHALQKQIWALEDQQAAAEEAARVAEERAGLERQLLALQGNTAELRRRELAQLDATNQALQTQIWALEDAQAVAEEREQLERRLLELQGDTNALRQRDLAALDESNRALQMQIWALEDLQRVLNDIDMNDFVSLVDYNRAVARANADILSGAANANTAPASVSTIPMPPVTNSTPTTTSGTASAVGHTDVEIRDAVRYLTDITQQLLTKIDNNTRRSSNILTVWDEDGLPEERVA
jgi:hypothetical protein